ncbi:hypothetical protein [Neptuniibacter sp. QD37_11]|uniref:hypothetical protein n=1 Tax=Neptuniibacter sp. QD37_11 TaxID=3398209 RepID=UPI0039F45FE3
MSQETITLYHGTDCESAKAIMKDGFDRNKTLYLTSRADVADYYAEAAMEDTDTDDYTILSVTVPVDALKVDFMAISEPLTFYREGFSERDWHAAIDSGEIPGPDSDNDWHTSLNLTSCVLITDPEVVLNVEQPDQNYLHDIKVPPKPTVKRETQYTSEK